MAILKIDEIKQLMEQDRASSLKAEARVGERYYEGNHDIRDYKICAYNDEGELEEDENATNIRISHPFFTELVDQQVQYMLSGGDFIYSEIPELQDMLDDYFNDDFKSELAECLTSVVSQGFGYLYAYTGDDDRVHFENADGLNIVEVRARDTDDNCDYIIYWFKERLAKQNKTIKRIQVWDKEQTYYYVQDDEGDIKIDDEKELNPRPHIIYKEDDEIYYKTLGFIPFFRLDNNRKQMSALAPIKDIIDDYDLMSCALSNNLQDFDRPLYVVKGYKGHDLKELTENLKAKKRIGVNDTGDVDIKTIDIPYAARQTKLDLDEKNIYKFGMGFNSSQVGDGNITNIVIKSRYVLLDLKCNKLEDRLKHFLSSLLNVILDEINEANDTNYTKKDVEICFEREVMTNALDNEQIKQVQAQTKQTELNSLLTAATEVGFEAVKDKICEVLDIDPDKVEHIEDMLDDEIERMTENEKTETI